MASISVGITIKNKNQIRRAFAFAPQAMADELEKAVKLTTFAIDRTGKQETPVDTGRLRSSYRTSFSGSGIKFKGLIDVTANYASYVHEGTRFMKGRPFLQNAVDKNEKIVEDFFTKAVKNALNKVGRKT